MTWSDNEISLKFRLQTKQKGGNNFILDFHSCCDRVNMVLSWSDDDAPRGIESSPIEQLSNRTDMISKIHFRF